MYSMGRQRTTNLNVWERGVCGGGGVPTWGRSWAALTGAGGWRGDQAVTAPPPELPTAEIPMVLTRAVAKIPNLVLRSSWGCLSQGAPESARGPVCRWNHGPGP